MSDKRFFLVRGVPGSGKTTIATRLSSLFDCAADDFPAFWETGSYQYKIERQKDSHEYCFDTINGYLEEGKRRVAVHNVFASTNYIKPYVEAAKKNGYTTFVITCEAVILPNGELAQSDHNVPPQIIESSRDRWQPYIPKTDKGLSISQLAEQLTDITIPEAIIFDWDSTLIGTESGELFPNSPDDMKVLPAMKVLQENKHFILGNDIAACILSNQRGLGSGHITLDFLKARVAHFLELVGKDFYFSWFFPIHKGGDEAYTYIGEVWEKLKIEGIALDKPNTGIIRQYVPHKSVWVVGDGHLNNHSSDWQLCQNIQSELSGKKVRYIPAEMLEIAIKLARRHGNN